MDDAPRTIYLFFCSFVSARLLRLSALAWLIEWEQWGRSGRLLSCLGRSAEQEAEQVGLWSASRVGRAAQESATPELLAACQRDTEFIPPAWLAACRASFPTVSVTKLPLRL